MNITIIRLVAIRVAQRCDDIVDKESDTPTIDHLIMRKFVTGPPSYCLVIAEFTYNSCVSMNAEKIEHTVLFDRHLSTGSDHY